MKKYCFGLSILFKFYFFLFLSLLYGKVLEKDFKMNNIFLIFQLFIYTWFPIEYVILFFGIKFFLHLNPHFIYLTNRNVELWKVILPLFYDRIRFKQRLKLTTSWGEGRVIFKILMIKIWFFCPFLSNFIFQMCMKNKFSSGFLPSP